MMFIKRLETNFNLSTKSNIPVNIKDLKHLGVTLDCLLTWNLPIKKIMNKATKSFFASKCSFSKTAKSTLRTLKASDFKPL